MATKYPLSQQDREAVKTNLAKAISNALATDEVLRMDAVLYGRAGLNNLPDSELLELAQHWHVE